MSRTIELSEEAYASLERAAVREGLTPAELIARDYGAVNGHAPTPPLPAEEPAKGGTLYDRLKPYIGAIDSGRSDLSTRGDEIMAEELEKEHRGHRP